MIYTGDRFPAWKGNLFVGAMARTHLRRVVFEGTRVVHEEQLLHGLGDRIRDVRQGPDGCLYLLTDSYSGEILKIEPVDSEVIALSNVSRLLELLWHSYGLAVTSI